MSRIEWSNSDCALWGEGDEMAYETLEEMTEDGGEAKLFAEYSSNNGIRIQIQNWFEEHDLEYEQFLPDGWDAYSRVFDFTPPQARLLGEALIRWANAKETT